jgi:hypothetical protein
MKWSKNYNIYILGIFLFFSCAGTGMIFPEISVVDGLNVRILYDFSGSMYPGYPDHPRHETGAKYFYEYAHFRRWLADFVTSQTRFNAKKISMSIFRSLERFRPEDIKLVYPPVTISRFDVGKAFSQSKPPGVDYTYIAESLDYFSRSFEGLIWLITDNRVEKGEGSGTTRDFFMSLRDTEKYRSIHIYKLPFEDRTTRQHANLAIYGILVSPVPIPPAVSRWYDERFFEFKHKFKDKQHLKLKDLSVEPIKINIEPIEVDIETYKKGFTEGKFVRLPLSGTIRSNLTQHTIIGGTLSIEVIDSFVPDTESQNKYSIKEIPGKYFDEVNVDITGEIPPGGTGQLDRFFIKSKKTVSLSISGIGNLIEAATGGVRVKYSGKGLVSSNRIDVAIKQEGITRITGIYSSTDIQSVFGAQSTITRIQANPSEFDITFALNTGHWRGLFFLLIFLILLIPFVLIILFMTRKEGYRVKKGDKEDIVSLKRLGSCIISRDGVSLGVLKRGMGNVDSFSPNTDLASLTVTPGNKSGEYNVLIDDKKERKGFKLKIDPVKESRLIKDKNEPVAGSSLETGSLSDNKPGTGSRTIDPQQKRTPKPNVTIRKPR